MEDGGARQAMIVVLRWIIGVGGAITGAGLGLLVLLVGHCSAFAGRCPTPAGNGGDAIGGIAMAAFLVVAAPMIALRWSRRGVAMAVVIGALAAGFAAALLWSNPNY